MCAAAVDELNERVCLPKVAAATYLPAVSPDASCGGVVGNIRTGGGQADYV